MIRTPRLAVTAGLALLLLSGCGSSAARPGAAAVVGEERIPAATLTAVVERGLADPQAAEQFGQDRPAYQREALTRLVNREVLQVAAEREGVTVDQGEVDAQLQELAAAQPGGREALETQAAQNGIAARDIPLLVRDALLQQALGDELTKDEQVPQDQLQALYDDNLARYDQVRSRHILVADEARARSILAQVQADPSRFEELAAEFSTDTSNKDTGGNLGTAGRGQFVEEFEALLFSAKPGSYGVVQTQFGWHVVNVIERQTTSLREATPELRRAALAEQQATRTQELLREVAKDLGVEVNPRFGRWDAETGRVEAVDDPNGVTTPAPDGGSGEQVPGGPAPEGAAPEGAAPEGAAPEAEAPEGEAPLLQEDPGAASAPTS